MIKRDYYEVLELERGATGADIKKAYRRMALAYHPDRNPDDPHAEERFKEASEAYEVLSDSRRRQLYDTYGHQGLAGAGFHGFTDVGDIFGSMGDIFEEFFGQMGGMGFGRAGGRRRARAGADMRFDLTISFMEAVAGTEKEISVTREVACETCNGTGQAPGSDRVVCHACNGAGQITQRQGFFVIQTACPQCRGEGSRIEKYCDECRGGGRVTKHERIKVKVPAGIENGMQLVLRGKGHDGERGADAGDLFVFVSVAPHELFERIGDDILLIAPISFPQAALGDTVEVPGLGGDKRVKVPAGTESGNEVRIKGEGIPSVRFGGRRGDEIVRFVVKTPKKLSKKQKELLRRLMEEE